MKHILLHPLTENPSLAFSCFGWSSAPRPLAVHVADHRERPPSCIWPCIVSSGALLVAGSTSYFLPLPFGPWCSRRSLQGCVFLWTSVETLLNQADARIPAYLYMLSFLSCNWSQPMLYPLPHLGSRCQQGKDFIICFVYEFKHRRMKVYITRFQKLLVF